jgi:hypothetical protein
MQKGVQGARSFALMYLATVRRRETQGRHGIPQGQDRPVKTPFAPPPSTL